MDNRKTGRPPQRKRIPFEEWQKLYSKKTGHATPLQHGSSLFESATPDNGKTLQHETSKTPTE